MHLSFFHTWQAVFLQRNLTFPKILIFMVFMIFWIIFTVNIVYVINSNHQWGCQYSELHLTQITTFEQECKKGFCNQAYRISLNNSWGWLFLFRTKRGDYSREGDYLREAIILNIDHWKSRPKYIFFNFPIKYKK